MVKFIKKMKDFVEERKESVISKASAGASFTLDQQYKLFFWGMNGYIEGKPDRRQRLVWKACIENVVDNLSTCNDPGYEGMKIKQRVKLIGKNKIIPPQDRAWIELELKQYFEDSMKKQLTNISPLAIKEILDGKISQKEAKNAYMVYSKNPNKFRR